MRPLSKLWGIPQGTICQITKIICYWSKHKIWYYLKGRPTVSRVNLQNWGECKYAPFLTFALHGGGVITHQQWPTVTNEEKNPDANWTRWRPWQYWPFNFKYILFNWYPEVQNRPLRQVFEDIAQWVGLSLDFRRQTTFYRLLPSGDFGISPFGFHRLPSRDTVITQRDTLPSVIW